MTTLTLERRWESVGLERRCTVRGAGPIPSFLMPTRDFVPDHALFSIRTSHTLTGAPETGYTVYVWPPISDRYCSAQYTSKRRIRLTEPAWVSQTVADLQGRFLGERMTDLDLGDVLVTDHYLVPTWANTEWWSVSGADPINGKAPGALTVGWNFADSPDLDRSLPRYRATVHTAYGKTLGDWGGMEQELQKVEDWPGWVEEALDASLARLMLSDPSPAPLC